jgi:nitroimidazol reductase NimA-like FMN-containing flavoprotein (pyridoxamine 5'-phosphate oxidase superfamily)
VIDRCDVCRIGIAGDGAPYIVPMNFGFEFSGSGVADDVGGGVFNNCDDTSNTSGGASAIVKDSSDGSKLTLWFHCAVEGRKIDLIADGCEAGFEMDTDHELRTGEGACDYSMNYASVIGIGRIRKVTDESERLHGLKTIMSHYGGAGLSFNDAVLARTCVLRLDVAVFTCKRLKK